MLCLEQSALKKIRILMKAEQEMKSQLEDEFYFHNYIGKKDKIRKKLETAFHYIRARRRIFLNPLKLFL